MAVGWPDRAGRIAYGAADMVDERPTANPKRELRADELNLAYWQLGAIGRAAPKAVLVYAPGTPQLDHGLFAWDQVVYSAAPAPFPWFSVSVLGTGNYRFTFDSTVPDMNGDSATLRFDAVAAQVANNADPVNRVEAVRVSDVIVDVLASASGVPTAPSRFLLLLW